MQDTNTEAGMCLAKSLGKLLSKELDVKPYITFGEMLQCCDHLHLQVLTDGVYDIKKDQPVVVIYRINNSMLHAEYYPCITQLENRQIYAIILANN
jgi:hypothetical protein